jgi:hypothetical protein
MTAQLVLHKQILPPDVLTRVTIRIYATGLVRNNNGTARFKNVHNCLNNNTYAYLETSGGQGFNLYLNVYDFFNTSFN